MKRAGLRSTPAKSSARRARASGGTTTPQAPIEHVRIESLAAGGAGVGRLADGVTILVPQTAAGDLVEVQYERRGRLARGRLLGVIDPSPDRVEPPCPRVHSCGGCDFMHLSQPAQQAEHAAIVRAAVEHVMAGGSAPDIRMHPPPACFAYRTRARLFARAAAGHAAVGFRALASHDLVAVGDCIVLDPSIAPVLGTLPQVLSGACGEGDILVARGSQMRPVLTIHWRGDLASAWSAIDAQVSTNVWAGVRVWLERVLTVPADFGDPDVLVWGLDALPLRVAAGGFAQPSDAGAVLLARRVAELVQSALQPLRPRHIVELFAGSGTLSVLLAPLAASFVAVELGEDAAGCARRNLADRSLQGKVTVADANTFAIPARTEVVVIDPPRAGAPGAVRAIAGSGVKSVVYVACDPITLARDLGVLLRAGFALTDIETFELFPQTSHVETVARLVRRRAKG